MCVCVCPFRMLVFTDLMLTVYLLQKSSMASFLLLLLLFPQKNCWFATNAVLVENAALIWWRMPFHILRCNSRINKHDCIECKWQAVVCYGICIHTINFSMLKCIMYQVPEAWALSSKTMTIPSPHFCCMHSYLYPQDSSFFLGGGGSILWGVLPH